MIGLIVIAALCVTAFRVADVEDMSPWIWTGLMLGLCLLCAVVIPLPFINLIVAAVIWVIAFMVAKPGIG